MPLLLTQSDLRPLVDDRTQLDGAIAAIEQSVLQHHRGESGVAAYIRLPLAEQGDSTSVFLSAAGNGQAIRVFPSVGSSIPAGEAHAMLLLDAQTGMLRAILSGDDLNPLRTAVPAAVGAKHLAPLRSTTLAILGSGTQARSHIRTLHHVLPSLERVRVWSPTVANRERFAAEAAEWLRLPVEAVESAQAACAEADVISAAGQTHGPAAESAWVRPGALLVSMTRAAPPDLAARGRVFVPSRRRPAVLAQRPTEQPSVPGGPPPGAGGPPGGGAAAAAPPRGPGGAGTMQNPYGLAEERLFELAEVLLGRLPPRERPDQTLIWELAAMYSWDVPIMTWAYYWAVQRGAGTEIHLTA